MAPERTVRTLEQSARTLLAPLLAAQPRPGGWHLRNWDCEQGLCVLLARGDAVLLLELEPRDDTRDCFTRTARFNVCARYRFGTEPLDAAARAAVLQLAAMVQSREELLYWGPRPEPDRGASVRELEVERVLMPEGRGQYYLNAYAGCMIGCAFCYVAKRSDMGRGLQALPVLPWGRYVDVKVNAAEVLAREVREHPPGIVRMSPILTDPYQPLEKRYRITRQCLEVLREAKYTPMVLTRARLVEDDVPLLQRFERALVGVSIPTDDDAMRALFEPGADSVPDRLAALRSCHAAGLLTFAVVQPVLPMNVDKLVAEIAPYVHAVRFDRMHELAQARPLYEAAGRLDALEPGFFERTTAALRSAFVARGIPIDDEDDLTGLLQSVAR